MPKTVSGRFKALSVQAESFSQRIQLQTLRTQTFSVQT